LQRQAAHLSQQLGENVEIAHFSPRCCRDWLALADGKRTKWNGVAIHNQLKEAMNFKYVHHNYGECRDNFSHNMLAGRKVVERDD
jgi:hypothetical protein